MGNAWDIGKHESPLAYTAFRVYLMLGPTRSQRKVMDVINYPHQARISKWSTRFHWLDRVKAVEQSIMDSYVDTLRGVVRNSQTIIVEDALKNYNELQDLFNIKVAEMRRKLSEDINSVSAEEISKMANIAKNIDDLGRRAAGLPGTINANTIKNDEKAPIAKQLGWSNPPPKRVNTDETIIEFD